MLDKMKSFFRMLKVILFFPIVLLTLSNCTSLQIKTPSEGIPLDKTGLIKSYEVTVSNWNSYEDLVRWMEKNFSFDQERYKKFEGTLPIPRAPEETFYLKSGIDVDAAEFLKKTLHRISPSYKAQIVVILVRPNTFNHYVCSFKKEGKLFIMDYGTPYREITGLHGPFRSLNGYKQFYEKHHPERRQIEGIGFLP